MNESIEMLDQTESTESTESKKPSLKQIAVRNGTGLEVKNMADVWHLSVYMVQAGLVPASYKGRPSDVSLAIVKGLELGLKPLQAVQKMYVINGSPVLWGDMVIGVILATGQLEDVKESYEGEGTNRTAICSLKRKGIASAVEKRFSMADAMQAGLAGKGTWKAYADDMLMYKARSRAARTLFADALGGMYVQGDIDYVEADAQVVEQSASDALADSLAAS